MPTRLRDLLPLRLRSALGRAGRRMWAVTATPWQPAVPAGSVVALCHCHDPGLVPELATRLLCLPSGAALHVSSADPSVFEAWARYRGRSRVPVRFHRCENRGRDLRPFFAVAREIALAPDTIVLKLHGKRSAYSARGDWWRRDTIRGLLPGPFSVGRVRRRFHADPSLALLGAPGSFIAHPLYWGRNQQGVEALMRRITGQGVLQEDLGFFAGSMFWIRGGFLTDLLPHIDLEAFEPEPLAQDGTYAHAVERVIGMAALAGAWTVGEVGDDQVLTRDAVRHRTVGYL